MKIRVLHVITTITRGGAENHLMTLIQGQREAGMEVSVAFLKGDGYWRGDLEKLGVRVFPLSLSAYGDPRPVIQIARIIRDLSPDLVHGHLPPAELYAWLALIVAGKRGVPFIVSKHNDTPFYAGPGAPTLERAVASRAAAVIAISEAVGRKVRGVLGHFAAARVHMIHYGIDVARFQSVPTGTRERLRAEWGITPNAFVVGTLARFVTQKALHILINGFADALSSSRLSDGARLVLVGRGPLEGELRARVAERNIGDKVLWVGFREDVECVLQVFDAFVLTSLYEGFGLVLLESMAAGVPVVGTNVSALPEVIGDAGILVPPGDAQAVASAIMSLTDPERHRDFSDRGILRAREFSLDEMHRRTIAVYRSCLRSQSENHL